MSCFSFNLPGLFRLAISLLLIQHISAQNNSCYDDEFATVNATASVEIHAMHPQDPFNTSPYGYYNLSTAVKEVIDVAQKSSVIKQKFWLRADPMINTAPQDLPFVGCAFFLQAAPGSSLIGGKVPDAQCQNALPGSCKEAILDIIQSNVTNLFEDVAYNNSLDTCAKLSEILRTPPPDCKGAEWENVIPTQPFGNPSFLPMSEPNCGALNIFNGSATSNSLVEITSGSLPLGNQTYYNKAVRTTTPVFLASWPRNATRLWTADVRVACLTPETHIEAGSLIPKNGAASQCGNVGVIVWTMGLLALGLLQWY